jgi:hypothetical protein
MITYFLIPIWIGISTGIVGISGLTWQFWLILGPTCLLLALDSLVRGPR